MQENVKFLTLRNFQTNIQDQYALSLNPIGEGKYAKVYKAQNINNPSKIFAVKVIKIENEDVKKQYLKELKIIKNLPDCPNLVKTHKQHLQNKNNLYIFQQFCESGTLMSFRADKFGAPLTQNEVYDIFYQISNGLITLLDSGIVHEDIKPVNILKKGKIFKLCDFGVSEILNECKQSSLRKGTISYMPPQKLKSKRFLPNEKSDIYSLGTCIYQIIFGFHPYLKKKTSNYKQYLKLLEQSSLTPIPILMKKIKSQSSLRLQNFLRFLEKMIELKQKNRASLSQLKQFIKTTQPFKDMKPPQEQPIIDNDKGLYNKNYNCLLESVVEYRRQNNDDLRITTDRQRQIEAKVQQQRKKIEKQQQYIEGLIMNQFHNENQIFVDIIGLLIRGIDYIRRSNFNLLNEVPINKNITSINLKNCMISRYVKYLVYEFSIQLRKRQLQKYEAYIKQQSQQLLHKDISYLCNQFNKFMIQCSFQNRQQFEEQISNLNKLQFWKNISQILTDNINSLSTLKNNKYWLLSVIYCLYIPKVLSLLGNTRSIYRQQTIKQQVTESYLGDSSIQDCRNLLQYIFNLQSQKMPRLIQIIQKQLQKMQINTVLQFEQESQQFQILAQNDLNS